MSWYTERINYNTARLNEIQDSKKSTVNDSMTICFTVIDMHNQNDYDIIKKYLLGLQGIIDVKPYYTPKKLCVNFDPNLTGLEYIIYGISKLGYHYINRG